MSVSALHPDEWRIMAADLRPFDMIGDLRVRVIRSGKLNFPAGGGWTQSPREEGLSVDLGRCTARVVGVVNGVGVYEPSWESDMAEMLYRPFDFVTVRRGVPIPNLDDLAADIAARHERLVVFLRGRV